MDTWLTPVSALSVQFDWGCLVFLVTQLLTGHGSFIIYLHQETAMGVSFSATTWFAKRAWGGRVWYSSLLLLWGFVRGGVRTFGECRGVILSVASTTPDTQRAASQLESHWCFKINFIHCLSYFHFCFGVLSLRDVSKPYWFFIIKNKARGLKNENRLTNRRDRATEVFAYFNID